MGLEDFKRRATLLSTQLNDNFSVCYTVNGLNLIRELQDRDVDISTGFIDMWAEAYIDASGRKNTVNAGSTTALFSTDHYGIGVSALSTDYNSLYDPNVMQNPTWIADFNDSTAAVEVVTAGTKSTSIGYFFGSTKSVLDVRWRVRTDSVSAVNMTSGSLAIDTYNGSSWDAYGFVGSHGTTQLWNATGTTAIGTSCSGVRLALNTIAPGTSVNHLYWSLEYTTTTAGSDGTVWHDIPTGTLGSTVSSAIGVPLLETWEDGANIEYKLQNVSEDSGWLNCMRTAPEISDFTAFTSEPTRVLVKITAATGSPAAGVPTIKGFSLLSK